MMASGEVVLGGDAGGLALIQKALGDERARSDQHKQNYEHIKSQLAQLQERYSILETQYQQSLEDGQSMQTKAKAGIQQLQKELREKNADMEQLKMQVLTPEREEILRQKIAFEQEQPFAEKLYSVEIESEKYRNDYNSLRYQLAVVQSEFESEQKKAERTIEELKFKFEAEKNRLQQERDEALAQCLKATETEGENKRHLSRENFKLQNRVKSYMEEVAEEKAKREDVVAKLEAANKRLLQQIADLKLKLRNVDSERSNLAQQLKFSSDKVETLSTSDASLRAKMIEGEKQKEAVADEKEKLERDFKRELNSLQIDAVKLKSDHAREKDELNNRLAVLRVEVDVQKEKVAKKVEEALEKEREGEKRVAEMREEEWKVKQKREEEKQNLEKRVADAEKRVVDESAKSEAEKEKFEEEKLVWWEEKRDFERNVAVWRRDVVDKEKREEELAACQKRMESLNDEMVTLSRETAESKLGLERAAMENEKSSSKVETYSRELEVVGANLAEFKANTEKYATKMKAGHEAAIKVAQEKYDRVVGANRDIKKTADANAATYQKQKTKYLKVIRHFKRSNALVKAEMEELKALNENLGRNVPAEAHFALKKKLKEMIRRHAEFQSLLLYAAPDAAVDAAATAGSASSPLGSSFAHLGPAALSSFSRPRFDDDHDDDDDDENDRYGVPSTRRAPLSTATSQPNPILRNASQNPILPERKTKSAVGSSGGGGKQRHHFHHHKSGQQLKSLEDLKNVKERAEKLNLIQEDQDKEIHKHLEKLVSSPELLVEDDGEKEPCVKGRSGSCGNLPSSTSSVSEKRRDSNEYSSDPSFSDDKENF